MTSSISYRKITAEDYNQYYEIRSEPLNLRWTGYEKAPDYASFRSWFLDRVIDTNREIYLFFKGTHAVGALSVDCFKKEVAIGYSVKEQWNGKGIASFMVQSAKKIVLEVLDRRRDFKRVFAWVSDQNAASLRVMEKSLFRPAGKEEWRNRLNKKERYIQFEFLLEDE